MNFKTLAEDELEELRLPRFSLRAAFCRPFLGTGQAVCKSRKSPVRPKLAKRYCDAKGSCGIVTHPSCRRKGVEPAAYIKVLILSGAILHTTFLQHVISENADALQPGYHDFCTVHRVIVE